MGVCDACREHKRIICRTVKTILIFLLDVADFATDWMLFENVKRAEKGLVYDTPDDAVVYGFLVFSIIGTITFIVEIIVLFVNFKADGKYNDVDDILHAVVIWIEDIPQVIISFSVVLCRQDVISGFQVVKAIIVIVGILVRVITLSIKLRHKQKKDKCTRLMCGKIGILAVGVVIEALFACVILGLTYIGRDPQGKPVFRAPTTFFSEPVEEQSFLNNVGLFVYHPGLFDMGKSDTGESDSAVNWLHLDLIYNLKEGEYPVINNTFIIEYKNSINSTKFLAVWMKSRKTEDSETSWMLSGCYSIDPSTQKITVLQNDTCINNTEFTNTSERLVMKFRFERPDTNPFRKKRRIGEVFSHVKLWQNGRCSSVKHSEDIGKRNNGSLPLTLHYFKINEKTVDPSSARHFVNEMSTSLRFFRNDGKDMESVRSAITTGWTDCPYTGSVSPVYEENMVVDCDFNH